ncbi:hypothetical protein DASC09_004480 [Saccharomycopsis crataegensis]|uniref:Sodium/nucleoside cotransporter n=1 Tax=Saccharomycopsis crataegensis TaxID=43959 RepID=A0AAV5QE64_9ASCO|nr:hypothetical protein DASC09_004480 [Saccharomycopsis crataegensis]
MPKSNNNSQIEINNPDKRDSDINPQSKEVREKINEVSPSDSESPSRPPIIEKGEFQDDDLADQTSKPSLAQRFRRIYARCKWIRIPLFGAFITAWWISIIVQPKQRHRWLIPTIVYLMILLRLVTIYLPLTKWLMKGLRFLWMNGLKVRDMIIPEKFRILSGALLTLAVMLIGTMVPSETKDSTRLQRFISFLGICVALVGLWATSTNRSKIRWVTVINGILMQYIIALFVLRTKVGYDIFHFLSSLSEEFLGFARNGVAFVTTSEIAAQTYFFFSVLPAVLFFISVVYILLYLGFIQWATGKFSKFFFWSMKVSGGEAVVAAASPFIGIGESAVLIKGLLPYLTTAEVHQVMCSGFATISGSVLIAYIGIGINSQALVSSCVMSIPASLSVSKLRYPEVENSLTAGDCTIPDGDENLDESQKPQNILQAFSNGAYLGIVVAGTIMANQVCIISFVALINGVLTWFGSFWGIHKLTLEVIGGYLLYPVAFFLGAPFDELLPISQLIATKFIENEYNGYTDLIGKAPYNQMSKRGQLLATYSLCGFSNFGSVGTQLGVLSTLAPNKSKVVARTIFSALITGGISTLLSACVAGMVIHDLSDFKVSSHSST